MKVQPIPQELWGALNHVIDYAKFKSRQFTDADYEYALGIKESIKLLDEYASCFGADGRVSQRGEIPQCWNDETIFTPYREMREDEQLLEQPMLPFTEVKVETE
jgi:hypothetical protein